MQGPADNPGVNVRALAMLFGEARARAPDIEYEIGMSLLEIYNDQIKDLLGDTSKKLKCVQGKDGQEVPDLTIISVKTKEQVLEQLAIGSKRETLLCVHACTCLRSVAVLVHMRRCTHYTHPALM